MIERRVAFAPEALDDLRLLYDWLADAAGPATALRYVERLEAYCRGFAYAAERGHLRNDIHPCLRVVGFERRVTIAFNVSETQVTTLRLSYGGLNWERQTR